MSFRPVSPRIKNLSWGRFEVEGQPEIFKDAKLYPGGAREWDWTETGTRHWPGIQPADVEELLEKGATAIVLSTGMQGRLAICPETLAMLRQNNVEVVVSKTKEAAKRYNILRETKPSGALIHSTC